MIASPFGNISALSRNATSEDLPRAASQAELKIEARQAVAKLCSQRKDSSLQQKMCVITMIGS